MPGCTSTRRWLAPTTSSSSPPLPADYLPRLGALADKVVLGADFPNIPYAYFTQLAALHRFDLGEDWLRKVLWHNGARLMGL